MQIVSSESNSGARGRNVWSEIYRRDGIGAKLLDRENLAGELTGRNYSDESIGKILAGNMMRVLREHASLDRVCPIGWLQVFPLAHRACA